MTEVQPVANAPSTSELVASFHERVREMNPSLGRECPSYQAAVLLLSLTSLPPQIDHLSHWLSIPREFVARCIRRLVDNGVLSSEGLIGGWTGEAMVEEAFWADVNVANGMWLRRHDSRGSLEWIEAGGGWQKPYDYVTCEIPEGQTKYIASEGSRPQLNLDCFTVLPELAPSTWIGSVPDPVGISMGEDDLPFLEDEVQDASAQDVATDSSALRNSDLALTTTAAVVWLS